MPDPLRPDPGPTLSMTARARAVGLRPATVFLRLARGWPEGKALSTPAGVTRRPGTCPVPRLNRKLGLLYASWTQGTKRVAVYLGTPGTADAARRVKAFRAGWAAAKAGG